MNSYDYCYCDKTNDIVVSRIGRIYNGTCNVLRLRSGKKPVEMCFIMDDHSTLEDYCDAIKHHLTSMKLPYVAAYVTL